jgi:AcrR family transcriptional regulator
MAPKRANVDLVPGTKPKEGRRKAAQAGRRAAIVAGLKQCMKEKGYADTSLTDLAKASGLSVSHLLYYFPSKEAALLELADEISGGVLAEVAAHRDETPEERIHMLVDKFFIARVIEEGEIGIVLEMTTLAVHRPELRAKLAAYNREIVASLEDLFAQTPRVAGLSAYETAEIAGALWMGLFNSMEYDDKLDEKAARRLYRRTLLSLANLSAAAG